MTGQQTYTEVTISTGNNNEKKEILVALLSSIGYEGFEDGLQFLKAYIPPNDYDEAAIVPIMVQTGVEYATSVIQYRNWNEAWEAGFDPVIIGDFCAIRALFHKPVQATEYEIIITPKMSFGTGHHATTYLMIEALQNTSVKDKSVFDFGTGTGVLAILAEKMGAGTIESVDIDEWSIENCRENILENNCNRILLSKADKITSSDSFDLILANINLNIILQHLGSMQEHLLPGGLIVLSGLLTGDEQAVRLEATKFNLQLVGRNEMNSWICLQFIKS